MSIKSTIQDLLNCMCTAMGTAGWTGDCCLVPGTPAFDTCCGEEGGNVGEAWGRLVNVTRREDAPQPVDPALDPGWQLTVELGATVCICFDLCDCALKTENGAKVIDVTEAALQGLACCYADQTCASDVDILSVVTIEPDGTCGGFVATLAVGYTLCCPAPE